MHIYSLKNLYELRKSPAINLRQGVGRVFFYKSLPGLVDCSACLWPIKFSTTIALTPLEGDIIQFTSFAQKLQKIGENLKADYPYAFWIENIIDSTPSRHSWENAILNSPLPLEKYLESNLPGDIEELVSYLLPSPLAKRMQLIHTRNSCIEKTRGFFNIQGFIHMETPSLVPSGGVEAYLNTFTTEYIDHKLKKWPLSLPTSPEFALKKLLCEGFPNIFQISRSFRNGGELSKWHEPEFLMLEWYRTGADLSVIMEDTRQLVLKLNKFISGKITLREKWPVFTVKDLFIKFFNINLENMQDLMVFKAAAAEVSHSITDSDDWDSVFYKLFFEKIEPFLQAEEACFVINYPKQMAALARTAKNPYFAERFEAYVHGIEICNGYHELTDTLELSRRFQKIASNRADISRDKVFENTAAFGLPPCSGNAMGLDRVIALVSGAPSLASLYPLPFLSQFPVNTVAKE